MSDVHNLDVTRAIRRFQVAKADAKAMRDGDSNDAEIEALWDAVDYADAVINTIVSELDALVGSWKNNGSGRD